MAEVQNSLPRTLLTLQLHSLVFLAIHCKLPDWRLTAPVFRPKSYLLRGQIIDRMRTKRIIASGLIGGSTRFLIGSILYVSPWVPKSYQKYENLFTQGSINYLSGTGTWLSLVLIVDWLSAILMAVLYSYTRKGLSKISKWRRGVFFGFLSWLVFSVPTSYQAWLLYEYPSMPDIVEILGGLMISVASGAVLAIAYEEYRQLSYYAQAIRD